MWLLSCEGDLFNGKRLWLRPGSTHLLGRTSGKSENGERVQYIEHKSVSRKHLVLQVSEVKPGDSTRLHVRPEVKAIDGSKTGTTIGGEKLKSATRVLAGDVHTIRLGSYESTFRLQWQPVVLSITTLPKGAKARNDALIAYSDRLEHAGIKIASEYVTNETTHLIVKKRNTAAGLQALVQGKWLLVDSFTDALANACERKDDPASGEQNVSLLEQEFDANWPREEDHIVPAGGEPVVRPNEDLKPRSDRADVFTSLTFVFLSQNQHDQLMPVVTSGGGKTTVFPFELDESTTQDVVDFVKDSAGQKRSGSDGVSGRSGRANVVVVRPISKEEGRVQDIMRDIEIALNQRSMEQNEFLDAILTNDASTLIRPLRDASPTSEADEAMPPEPVVAEDETTVVESPRAVDKMLTKTEPEETQKESSVISRRRNRQVVTASRFKGFDDFDESQIVQPEANSPEPLLQDRASSHAPSVQSNASGARQRSSRKRPAPEDPIEAERRMLDNLAPSTVGPKRQRLQQQDQKPAEEPSAIKREIARASRETANVLNMDIKGVLKERREQEEERRRQDEEFLQNALDMDISEIKKLVKVEDFDLPVRSASPNCRANPGEQRDWNPAWNGRPNFKKFRKLRPSGQENEAAGTGPPRRPKRLVALEEVPKRGLDIEEDYFLQSSTDKSLRSQSQAQAQARPSVRAAPNSAPHSVESGGGGGGNADSNESEDPPHDPLDFRRRIARSRQQDADAEELGSLVPDQVNDNTGKRKNLGLTQTLVADSQRSATTATMTTAKGRNAGGKRVAEEGLGGGTVKRARQGKGIADDNAAAAAAAAPVAAHVRVPSSRPIATPSSSTSAGGAGKRSGKAVVVIDDDDDDVLKFRRKKR